MNALQRLGSFGQSLWLDFISRKLLESGELKRLIEDDGVRGVTSNPAIFEKAIAEGVEYKGEMDRLRRTRPGLSTMDMYEALAVRDIQSAADVLRHVYEESRARDGYVSLEVTLHEGQDRDAILKEARHLWQTVSRPNVMIKVPGTPEGVAAFEELCGAGVNVNVTLLFAREVYERVAAAYVAGLEAFARKGGDLSRVASVASFFVSRIDTAIDKQLEAKLATAKSAAERFTLRALMGKAAIANARLAYAHYQTVFAGARWDALAKKGAQTQRVLWASTGTKNQSYSDVLYVEELIGEATVNTAPPATVDAFRDHGRARASLEQDPDLSRDVLAALEEKGISIRAVTDRLLDEGLALFAEAFEKILKAVEASKNASSPFAPLTYKLPDVLRASVTKHLDDWRSGKKVQRLWLKESALWTDADESRWLGWLDAPADAKKSVAALATFAAEIRRDGFAHVLLLGMGGSSLCPEVLNLTFGSRRGFPVLEVLDSTDPAQIAAIEKKVDLKKTVCIVASKSGSTLEPSIFEQHFWERMTKAAGAAQAGRHFIAITDPGSKLEEIARKKGYRKIFPGVASIGGRFSALSNFGLVPAALIGLDLERFVDRASEMAQACRNANTYENPGVLLGVLLGAAARSGRDKLTLVISPELASMGAWLEQLIAESTGKLGKGIVPVDQEPIGAPECYGDDRLFVYVRLSGSPNGYQDNAVAAIERAGQAVVRIEVAEPIDIGAGFFRWEIATAVAGSILGIHPFDQPDVEASKAVTRALTGEYEKSGALPIEKPFFEAQGFQLFADSRNATALSREAGRSASLSAILRALAGQVHTGDYFGILAYIERNAATSAELTAMRKELRDALRIATVAGFGPRFLHSTGQAYKGGPNSGVFLQITSDDARDLQVPGAKYTFGVVKAAQARGDFQVLAERGRRALRVHITGDVKTGLARLREALTQALAQPAQVSS